MLIFDKSTPLNLSAFNSNGLGYLTDFANTPKITEELNSKGMFAGNYKLEFEYSKDGLNAEYLQELNYIKVRHNNNYQIFYIESITKTLKRISVYAKHIFFIAKNGFIEDKRPTNDNATTALTELINTTQFNNTFVANSDTANLATAYYIRKNLIEAIITADNSMLSVWNCDLKLDNFTINLLSNRGEYKAISFEYGKNLTGVEYSVNYDNVMTRVMPIGANALILPEKYIDSSYINNYPFIYYSKVEFSDIGVDDETTEEEAYAKLRDAVYNLYNNGQDQPTINIKINWQDLSKTDEYKECAYLESLDLGDIVDVKFLGMKLQSRVIKTIWDCLQEKFISFELGDVKANLLATQKTIIQKEIEANVNVPSILSKAQDNATNLLTNAFGGHKYITKNEIFIMNTDDPNTATNIWRWNLNGLGYSSNGIDGPYELAATMDGGFVADFITTGTFDGQLIKAGSITADKISTEILQFGGTNLIQNSVALFGYEFWSNVIKNFTNTEIQQNTDSKYVILTDNYVTDTPVQIIQVQNGIYSVFFKYKKLVELAAISIKINDYEIILDSLDWKEENYTFEVLSNTISIEIISDTDNSCWIGDLVCRKGVVAGVWSMAPGESLNGGVKIGSSIEVTSSASNIKQKIDNDGNRIINTNTNEVVTEYTDKGLKAVSIESEQATIAKLLIQNVDGQVWFNVL